MTACWLACGRLRGRCIIPGFLGSLLSRVGSVPSLQGTGTAEDPRPVNREAVVLEGCALPPHGTGDFRGKGMREHRATDMLVYFHDACHCFKKLFLTSKD